MSPLLIGLLTFAAVSLAVAGVSAVVNDTFFGHSMRVQQRMKAAFRDQLRDRVQQSPLFHDLQQLAADTALQEISLKRKLLAILEQSGLQVTPLQLAITCVFTGSVAGLAVWFYSHNWLPTLVCGLAGYTAPILYVYQRRKRRIEKLRMQLPEAFEVMGRALRAGQSVPVAFEIVANDFPPPIAEHFAYCSEQQHLGIEPQAALRDLAHRTGVVELQILVVAMIVQRQSGGNLADLLSNLSQTVRKRLRLRTRLAALTGEGRAQAWVLSILPLGALAAIFFINPEYSQMLFERPKLLAGMFGWQLIGILWIRRIIDIEY